MCVGGPDPSDRFGLPGWLKLASGVELAGMPGLFANAQPFAGSGVFLACSSTPSVFPSGGLDQLAGCGLFDVSTRGASNVDVSRQGIVACASACHGIVHLLIDLLVESTRAA